MSLTTDTPPEAPTNRKRLMNRQQRGSQTGFSVLGAFLFGGVFVAAGIPLALIGLHVIPVDPSSVHSPYWVVFVGGACFAGAGCMVWGMGAKQWRSVRHSRDAMRRYAGSEAHADYAWNPGGFAPPRWGGAVQAVVVAGFMTVFLSMFNWWAWGVSDSPWQVKAVVVMVDLIVVFAWWKAALAVGRCAKFGGSRLVFQHFPYRLNEPVAVRWIAPRGITRADKGSFTFRCVEEYYEERGQGKDRNRWLVHDELCAEVQSFDTPHDFPPGRAVELRFTLPPGARATRLLADRPVYWELKVRLAMAGLDFEESYLVPVYGH